MSAPSRGEMGEKRRALDALWRETTAEPLWMPKTLWRYLRLKRRINLAPLSRADVHVLPGPRALSKCRACTDSCCFGKKNEVSLRLVDIAVLMDLGRTDLISRKKAALPEDSAARARFAQSRTRAVFPVLRQDESERCMALTSDKRCSLYPDWPLSCARFPYSLDLDDREIFYSPRCPSYTVVPNDERIETMIDAALGAYNERIRDWVLLEFARPSLDRLGFLAFLDLEA
jgi:Fe-S-cluster containining protein